MIEYTVVADIRLVVQEFGFTNKLIDLLVYQRLDKLRCLYSLITTAIHGIDIMIEVCHDLVRVVANTSIYQQEFGFTNKPNDLSVYRTVGQTAKLIFFMNIHDIWD